MTNAINNINSNSYNISSADANFKQNQHHKLSHGFIRQRIHENKIDEFFLTDTNAPKKRTSYLAMIGSIAGVLGSILLLAKNNNPKLKINSIKDFFKALNIKYEAKEIIAVGSAAAIGGLAGGLADRKEHSKLQKIEEAVFQLMNIAFPALLINEAQKLCNKSKYTNNIPIKLTASAISMVIGAGAAVKISNKLDDNFFDKYNKDPERKFKKKDLLVHFDDLIGALVLAKIPFADKLHAEKLLPAVFAWSGYHVGES